MEFLVNQFVRPRIAADRSVIAIGRISGRLGVVRWNCRSVHADRDATKRLPPAAVDLQRNCPPRIRGPAYCCSACQVGKMPFECGLHRGRTRLPSLCSTWPNHPTVPRRSPLDQSRTATKIVRPCLPVCKRQRGAQVTFNDWAPHPRRAYNCRTTRAWR